MPDEEGVMLKVMGGKEDSMDVTVELSVDNGT